MASAGVRTPSALIRPTPPRPTYGATNRPDTPASAGAGQLDALLPWITIDLIDIVSAPSHFPWRRPMAS
jgi:hypothetical protein